MWMIVKLLVMRGQLSKDFEADQTLQWLRVQHLHHFRQLYNFTMPNGN